MTERVKLLTAPFPWFGGKRRVAHLVWERFGDVRNYVEPFAGSLAVLLARPTEAKIETVNDIDCWIANFWRALQADPEGVAAWCDWPVNEADLHARHRWLHDQAAWRERMHSEPDFFDVKIAGWWVWGLSAWIGDKWCRVTRQDALPKLGGGRGLQGQLPYVYTGGRGVHQLAISKRRPILGGNTPRHGVHSVSLHQKRPRVGDKCQGRGVHSGRLRSEALIEYMRALAARLRHVRVCCGDWARITGPTPTFLCGLTGVFLDPPYGVADRHDCYGHDSRGVSNEVCAWAVAAGDNPKMRIALCGYAGEHVLPDRWECVAWKAQGGYANQGTPGQTNRKRERIWFSPHCLRPDRKGQTAIHFATENSEDTENGQDGKETDG